MSEQEERKNRRVGMIVSLTVHTLVLLIFAFLMAWREPNPPLPEYGIELNFGIDDAGTGEVQPQTPVTPSENVEESKPKELQEEVVEKSPPAENSEAEKSEVFDDPESQDIINEDEKVEEKPPVEENEINTTEESNESPETNQPVEEKEEDGGLGEVEKIDELSAANQGDKTDETGDQGMEDGDIDERALYGKPGGGGGPSLELTGWKWDFRPDPKDTSDEEGRIVFEIKIDDQGEIISIKTLEKTVSPTVEKIYKTEVEKLTFSKTNNLPPAPVSTGKITFIIRTN